MTLRTALLANGSFSLLSGAFLTLFARACTAFFALSSPIAFSLLGPGLIGFGLFVLYEVKGRHVPAIKAIVLLDVLWVLGSLAILASTPFGIAAGGLLAIALVMLVVAFFAQAQARALKREMC